ncbi:helix-turn-helix domain-containing protein [Priestia megaterium]|jgi:DNA-binding XRE family transcriptional regulator|uniref:helix-turn-helix transcriptional regulator n=1 Tax=Priestia megaterium TaxID=1404 RepID=UPI0022811B72|nr:helix-turn-helix domain-containing protein [Priestia megaterium]MCY9020875.1 helix-turn-helix domain-containing protein [Priestia megaterium]MCY9023102.1 helix-turn-helix domain-containing protein [Priestia megaterium]
MNKQEVTKSVSDKIRLIRLERNYSQDRMAEVIGISKKTLVQIEKGRTEAGWTTTVAVCGLFGDSEILQSVLGDVPLEVVEIIAHNGVSSPKDTTLGGRVWWKEIQKEGSFRLQQNMISQHYRILDDQDYRWFSSFDKSEAVKRFEKLTKK